jgi:hypothetical protein
MNHHAIGWQIQFLNFERFCNRLFDQLARVRIAAQGGVDAFGDQLFNARLDPFSTNSGVIVAATASLMRLVKLVILGFLV